MVMYKLTLNGDGTSNVETVMLTTQTLEPAGDTNDQGEQISGDVTIEDIITPSRQLGVAATVAVLSHLDPETALENANLYLNGPNSTVRG